MNDCCKPDTPSTTIRYGGKKEGRKGGRERGRTEVYPFYWEELHERLLKARHPKYYNEVGREEGREERKGRRESR